MAPPKHYPKPTPAAFYVLQDSGTGKYISTLGELPALKPLAEACQRPATREGLSDIVQLAADKLQPFGVAFEIHRIEPPRLVL